MKTLKIERFRKKIKISSAIENVYTNVAKVNFSNKFFRTDIGKKGLLYKRSVINED